MDEQAYNTLQRIARNIKQSPLDKAKQDIIKAGFYLDTMIEAGFWINLESEYTPVEQADIFNYVRSEAEF